MTDLARMVSTILTAPFPAENPAMNDLPCPFCGAVTVHVTPNSLDAQFPLMMVVCQGCEAQGPMAWTVPKAVDAWNTRVFRGAESLSSDRLASIKPSEPR